MTPGTNTVLSIQPATAAERTAALELVLRDASPEVRAGLVASEAAQSGVWTATRGEQLVGAIWFNVQPGRTAAIWPPRLAVGELADSALALLKHAVTELDQQSIQLAQAMLPVSTSSDAEILRRAGFAHLADLLYLFSSLAHASTTPSRSELEFELVDESNFERLAAVVERTYEATCDCPDLNGVRSMSDVLAGYLATGDSRAELWRFVRHAGHDVGCLLLADHRSGDNLELVYMGIAPAARGRRWGSEIVRHAQQMTRAAGRANLLLAVDAANAPALAMYEAAGMIQWERRSVFVRIRPSSST